MAADQNVGGVVVNVGAKINSLVSGMQQAATVVKSGVASMDASFKGLQAGIETLARPLMVFAAIAGALTLLTGAIKSVSDEARNMSGTLTGEAFDAVDKYNGAIDSLKRVFGDFVRDLIIAVMPALTFLIQTMEAVIFTIRAAYEGVRALGAYLGGDFTEANRRAALAIDMLNNAANAYNRKKADPAEQKKEKPQKSNADELRRKAEEAAKKEFEYQVAILRRREVEEKGNLQRILAIRQQELQLVVGMYGEMSKEYEASRSRIIETERSISEEQTKIVEGVRDNWLSVFEEIPNAFKNVLSQMQSEGGSFGEFMKNIFQNLALSFATSQARILATHAATWMARKGITAQGVLTTVALETWAAIKTIGAMAARAAAGAYAALVSIPFVGPFLAPAAAAAALGSVLAFAGNIKSAAGGYDIPPSVNPVTQLHANEMVLPAKYANVIRTMANGGNGGNAEPSTDVNVNNTPPVVVNISTMDAVGVRQFVARNQNIFADAVLNSAENGRASRIHPGRRG